MTIVMAFESSDWPKVSVCIPVKNGGGRLGKCLQSLRELDYPPDKVEVIIADGRSTDNTREVAQSFGALVLDNVGEIVASGRNLAFGAATGDFIASTDDDCVVPSDWIKQALEGFRDESVAAVGGISLLPADAPRWARAANYIFRLASHAGYSVQADHLSNGHAEDLPGCNTFYRTRVFHAVGAFDEGLVTAEDVDFHDRIRTRGFSLIAMPGLFVWHDKRPTPTGLFRQMRRFAEGRVQLSRKKAELLRPIHKVIGWTIPAGLLVGVLLAITGQWTPLVSGAVVPFVALSTKALIDGESPSSALLVPFALAITMAGWSLGYLKERYFPMSSTVGR